MDNSRKKDLVRAYKEQKSRPGIFAVRCVATGEAWVASAPDVGRKQSGIWFQLRIGSFPNKALQAAWKSNGEAAFAFEVLEEVDDENALLIPAILKERAAHWRTQLGAGPVID